MSPPPKKGRAGGASSSDARTDALDEAQALVEAVETEHTPPPSQPPPPPPPHASAAVHAKAQELNTLRDVAAKAAADLARVTQELEREKKRNNASKVVAQSLRSHYECSHYKGKEVCSCNLKYTGIVLCIKLLRLA